MSKISYEVLKKLQVLCRIKCTPEEEKDLQAALEKILSYMEQLNEIDTENIPPCNNVLEKMHKNILRKDEVGCKELISRDAFLEDAPEKIAGMVKIPPVINSF